MVVTLALCSIVNFQVELSVRPWRHSGSLTRSLIHTHWLSSRPPPLQPCCRNTGNTSDFTPKALREGEDRTLLSRLADLADTVTGQRRFRSPAVVRVAISWRVWEWTGEKRGAEEEVSFHPSIQQASKQANDKSVRLTLHFTHILARFQPCFRALASVCLEFSIEFVFVTRRACSVGWVVLA